MLIVSIMGEDLYQGRALSIAAWEHKYKDIWSLKKNLHELPLGETAKLKNIFKEYIDTTN